ncbi:DUF2126 domain-containing protein [Roseateles violae]|uniref:Transglutaminase family protein n=1 Tax=Roseateles violae TaxID=3058042 RepID=A0ABT8DWB0_9BURK|nr:transglutaminase family protein [Pelomonas sp. PFR6]MDN3922278.1 transglutaminase family protein [Pelomonas sp. PFR6]
MSIHIALSHVTEYRYDRRVALSPQIVRLRPAPHCRTPILSYSLRVEPDEHFINWQQDPFANYLARLVFPEKTGRFCVSVELVAEMAVYNPFDFFLEPQAQQFPFDYEPALRAELAPYLVAEPATPLVSDYLDAIDRRPMATIDFLVALNRRVQQDVSYLIRMEPGVQTPEQTLAKGSGSCRDSAWLLVQLLRRLGLAARFASGYLIQLKPDEQALDGPSGAASDFTDLHAWCEVYLPGAGWVGLDPTSGLLAGEGHIPLACTPQPSSAAPISGAVDAAEVEFEHRMTVTRIWESPRVTKPYGEDQWAAVLALGEQVDAELAAGDVRLTMGGEPTFVAVDDRDGAEWNTEALGPSKRLRAQELLLRLRDEYGQGGFLHHGQGKWYPGEQLPRWALSICWRADGQPCWQDPALFADEREPQPYGAADARRFIEALTQRLGLDPAHLQTGYEDSLYYLWRERRLPANVDPFDSRLDDAVERERLRRVFAQGLAAEVGYALPLAHDGSRWRSGPWQFRDPGEGEGSGRMYLHPGDSPMGYRLPLDALTWLRPEDRQQVIEQDPFAPRAALAAPATLRMQIPGLERPETRTAPAEDDATIRTALCVEARDPRRASGVSSASSTAAGGALYVFMPPLARLDEYLELLGAVEATAAGLSMQILLEGYPPPRDPRLKLLQLTPDPGVIEVNVQPAQSWAELVAHTEFLYEAARRSRLSSEKFMLDGRHGGTGGGNHFVLGGATPADSPFLRRPELLASLLAYWHNHPSLSYLFSGLFIGPTSQAPRVDEARNDQLRELEIALGEIARARERHGEQLPPWLIDRALRNLLIDASGNTHRSEFCIDKLYSPDSATGRLGLVELRGFEMPPHARMSIVQQLLLRALLARFWREPYRAPLVRWGTALHDRFMLPHFVQQDFEDVIEELRRAGYGFDAQWFAPHHEFRFPKIGELAARGVHLTLRNALEPWHVMGEETGGGGTVRYVDSSLERIEIKVSGLVDPRHRIAVNGIALPLQPTGRAGEYVAGLRFRAWHPPSALHPTIGLQAPLTIDLVDDWMQRSLAGCRYFVAHPGGRNYETLPVNAYEAESRRLARFTPLGHSQGRLELAPPRPSLEFPFTLDLRRAGP